MGTEKNIRDSLKPRLVSLAQRNHLGQLLANDRLINQPLAKDQTLMGPLEGLLNDETHVPDGGARHHPALVVEVGQDDIDALVLLAEQVLDGDLDVVEGDVRGTGGRGVGSLDGLGLDTLAALDDEHRKALVGLDARDEVIREDTVGDPLLGAVDDIVLAIGGLGSSGAETGDVGTGEGLGDGEADLLLAREHLLGDALLEGRVLVAVVEDAGEADHHAGHVAVLETAARHADLFLGHDHVVEVVELLTLDGTVQKVDAVQVLTGTHAHVQDTRLGHLVDQVLADQLAGALLLERLGREHLIGELADGALQAAVAVVEVRALELRGEPERLGVGDGRKVAGLGGDDGLLLALDGADGQVVVLDQHLVTVQVVEGRGGVLAADLAQDGLTARVGVEELGDIVDDGVDDEPHAVLGVVLLDLLAGEGLVGDV